MLERSIQCRSEDERWRLVEAHWDLPIRIIDPHAPQD